MQAALFAAHLPGMAEHCVACMPSSIHPASLPAVRMLTVEPKPFGPPCVQALQTGLTAPPMLHTLPPCCVQGPGRGTRSLGWQAMLSVVTIRFLLLPALGAVVVAGTVAAGWYMPPNPLFAFLMLLQVCMWGWLGSRGVS